MQISNEWKDYSLLDMANGEKLEKWGEYIFIRPDPQVVWNKKDTPKLWETADATYERSSTGGGRWLFKKSIKQSWKISYKELTFNIKPMGFKHTGLFPEQAVNWNYMIEVISKRKDNLKKQGKNDEVNILNLFAYTGGATVACAYAGANVCHVDSSAGMTAWAKDNLKASNLQDKPVRFIVDDVIKFVKREIRRGKKYDGIVMDPPSYGRGSNGEVWSIESNLYELLELCKELLSDNPLFVMVNTYTGGLSGSIIKNVLKLALDIKDINEITSSEIGLEAESKLLLPCGITTKWEGKI